MTIRSIYQQEPSFPASDQHPEAIRYQVGNLWVDAVGAEPTQADIDAILSPDPALIDQATLNAALAAEGSVVRALALVLLQEINTIRTKLPTPLPAYTQNQLVAALKAKMR
jgi:hypothetical protein